MRIRKTAILICFVLACMLAACSGKAEKETPHTDDTQAAEETAAESPGASDPAAAENSGTGISESQVTESADTGLSVESPSEETAGTDLTSESPAAETAATDLTAESPTSETAGTGHTSEAQAADTAAVSRGCIVIDPGHQQYANMEQEPVGPGAAQTKNKVAGGTSGIASGVPEYQLTLDIGLLLRDELEKRGYTVIMIRESNDVDISNAERAEVANEAEADAFVRLHGNGVDNHSVSGAMAICQTPGNPYNGDLYEASRKLSDCILDAYTQKTGIGYEQVWETDTMSGINWCTVPVTILEMGYMTNSEEDLRMQDPEMQELMAEGIADGIDAFMGRKVPDVE